MAVRKAAKKAVKVAPAERFVEPRRLYRSRNNKILCGVCGGIAEYMDVDPNIARLLWIIGTIFTLGLGIPAYILACLIIPSNPRE